MSMKKIAIGVAVLLVAAALFVGAGAAAPGYGDVTFNWILNPSDTAGTFNKSYDGSTWEGGTLDAPNTLTYVKLNSSSSNIVDIYAGLNDPFCYQKVEAADEYDFVEWRISSSGGIVIADKKLDFSGVNIYQTEDDISVFLTAVFKKKGTEITYTQQEQAYILTIPQSFAFISASDTNTSYVNLTNVWTEPDKAVQVNMSSDNFEGSTFNLLLDGTTIKHPYSIWLGGKTGSKITQNNYPVLTVAGGAEGHTGQKVLMFEMTGTPQYTGTYKDTLTFAAKVVDYTT